MADKYEMSDQRLDERIKELEKINKKNKLNLADAQKRERLTKQLKHLEASLKQEENYVRARGATSKTGSKLSTKSSFLGRIARKAQKVIASKVGRYTPAGKLGNKVKRAVSFTNWKYSRAILSSGTTLANKLSKFTLPAKMLGIVASKVSFLTNNSVARFLLPLIKPVARFIPYVGAALLVAEFGMPLLRWGSGLLNKPKTVKKPKPIASPPTFTGGQSPGVLYRVEIRRVLLATNEETIGIANIPTYGPVVGIEAKNFIDSAGGPRHSFSLIAHDERGNLKNFGGQTGGGSTSDYFYEITKVFRADGQPDIGGNISNSPFNPLLTTNSVRRQLPGESPFADYLPGGSKYQKRNSDPTPARKPTEGNKRKPLAIAIPAGKSITLTTPDGNSVTVAPSTTPRIINIPRPLPRQLPSEDEPERAKAPLPLTITSPTAAPIILNTPGTGEVTISIPGSEPYTFTPTNPKNAPLPLSTIKPIGKNQPKTLRPTPGTSPTKTPITTPTPATSPATNNDLENLLLPLGIVGGLAGLGLLVKQIHDRTSPQEIGKAAETATCRTTLPGGCSSNAMNNAANTGSQNTLNALGAGAQVVELGLLNVMNNKLGPQMPGGISSGMGRLSKFLGIDRIFNLLNFLMLLHNASMLSSSLKVTLLQTLSTIGKASGLLQSAEDESIDLNSVFNQGVEKFIVNFIGVEAWASMKLTWREYSPIYRAASNSLSAVGNMFSSIGNGIEVIGERTGKLGNALMSARVVPENAYNHMSEKMNVKTNKFMTFQTKTGGVTEFVSAINEVAESVIEGQESYTEATKATDKFKEELAKPNTKPGIDPDNELIKKEALAIKANLAKDPTGEDEKGLLSFLTDL